MAGDGDRRIRLDEAAPPAASAEKQLSVRAGDRSDEDRLVTEENIVLQEDVEGGRRRPQERVREQEKVTAGLQRLLAGRTQAFRMVRGNTDGLEAVLSAGEALPPGAKGILPDGCGNRSRKDDCHLRHGRVNPVSTRP